MRNSALLDTAVLEIAGCWLYKRTSRHMRYTAIHQRPGVLAFQFGRTIRSIAVVVFNVGVYTPFRELIRATIALR
jgi:hypothetical protein